MEICPVPLIVRLPPILKFADPPIRCPPKVPASIFVREVPVSPGLRMTEPAIVPIPPMTALELTVARPPPDKLLLMISLPFPAAVSVVLTVVVPAYVPSALIVTVEVPVLISEPTPVFSERLRVIGEDPVRVRL